MIDVDRYDCDFSLEEQVEASNKHLMDKSKVILMDW